jgi:glutamate--cysteine ligase
VSGGDGRPLRDLEQVHQVVAEACFPTNPHTRQGPGLVGLEVETFPVSSSNHGGGARRIPLDRLVALIDQCVPEVPGLGARDPAAATPSYPLAAGGTLGFEPGGQLEHSTAAHPTAAGALADVRRLESALAAALARRGVALATAGFDLWHPPGSVRQQLTAPRYPAMAAYLAKLGPHGAAMMRHTCALQVNLDLGGAHDWHERWLVANLAAPLACATFATSPAPGAVSRRARTWQQLDPTRTGFPRRLVDGSTADPVEQLADAALAAGVLLVRGDGQAPGGDAAWVTGRPGWSFGAWLRDGHARHGRPTVADLRYHLTTLFFEVRPRGRLELRAVDALPPALRPVPVTLLAGLLEDGRARARALALLEPWRPRLPALWRRAATRGVADPELCALAVETWSLALAGARRLPVGWLDPAHLDLGERFLDRFTLRGRCPADELRAALVQGHAAALAWTTTHPDPSSLPAEVIP